MAVPPVGGSSVQSIRTVVVLPGAVRAEEAEDLARSDRQVDVADRLDPALERSPQRARDDRGAGVGVDSRGTRARR